MTLIPEHLPTDPEQRAALLDRIEEDRAKGRRLTATERLKRQGLIFHHCGRADGGDRGRNLRPTNAIGEARADNATSPKPPTL